MTESTLCSQDDPDPRYDLGPHIDEHYAFLRHVLRQHLKRPGIALEFGVGAGTSTRAIAEHVHVTGFDSFEGLPEDWREGFPAGSFACKPPSIGGVHLVIGRFEELLPGYVKVLEHRVIRLVHIDCDLYSSTRTVFKYIGPLLKRGCVIVFDEWHGYEGCEQHEQRAFKEWVTYSGVRWRVLGHSFQQWGIQLV